MLFLAAINPTTVGALTISSANHRHYHQMSSRRSNPETAARSTRSKTLFRTVHRPSPTSGSWVAKRGQGWSLQSTGDDSNNDSNRNRLMNREMMGMAAAGAAIAVGVVFILSTGEGGEMPSLFERGEGRQELGAIEEAAGRIAGTVLPMSTSGALSAALGEGLAGVIGGAASVGISVALRWQQQAQRGSVGSIVLADGDYFLAKAASLPLLEATGLSPVVAGIASVLFAVLPYELVKIGAQRRRELIRENQELQRLLEEKRDRENRLSGVSHERIELVDPASLKPIREDDGVDFVEVFGDVMKWLSYDVLVSRCKGNIIWNGMPVASPVESAAFGALASLSSKIYADILYGWFGLGGEANRKKIQSRTLQELFVLYFSESVSAATLFGVYAAALGPLKRATATLFSEGVGNCVGSDNYNLCVDTFVTDNPLEASPSGELRAMVTSLVSLWNQWFVLRASPAADVRALVTALYSLWNQLGIHFDLSGVS